ncbi:MAG: hypothetical protein KatS3mg129_0054 [Leptospiraceae bacterium]|nr:MAG: hypothetical protein KatS3mg129_0054 [Leptospiraceae bacterium]
MNRMKIYKKRFLPLLFLLLVISLFAETENQKQEEKQSVEINIDSFKKEITEYYKPPDCFKLVFRTNINVPGYGVQSADGSVRADNKNNRIRIILVEANLGITLSWITIINNMAYLSNPRQEGVIKLPVEKLQLGSLANNNIQLPFSLFQDILFGRLPEELIQSEQWQYEKNQFIGQYLGEDGALIIFYFDPIDKKRIQKIEYKKPIENYLAIANFEGKFYNTKYPKVLKIKTYQNAKPLESMNIYFHRYIDNAWCKNEYFPIK